MNKKIKNFKELSSTALRASVLEIAEVGLRAIDTKDAVRRVLSVKDGALVVKGEVFALDEVEKIFVVGVGKCSVATASVLEEILDDRISGGIIMDVYEGKFKRMKAYAGTHPLPTEKNIGITREIINLLSDTTKNDLVIFIISGGGSSLLCQPENFTCNQESDVIDCLLKSGADIYETNKVRKHLSLARGGFLAKYAYPSRVVSLLFSDIPGGEEEFIASGPTIKDSTTIEDAKEVIKKYRADEKCNFDAESLIETPKDEKYFEKVKNILLVSNRMALEAMAERARELGLNPEIRTTCLSGEARDVGANVARELHDATPKTALLYGGETTVTVRGIGKGGRNQELALAALRDLREGEIILTLATDGKDNTDHAGAICDIIIREKADEIDWDIEEYLKDNDSYHFFQKIGGYILTGDTGSNVSDLIIAIKE